jgi:UDP-2,4-diacetamido-2,4,6-trideoxy-beta-L-altropyranose hydrolase
MAEKMKVLFRVDSSADIGSGHLIRCLTLADHLVGKGVDVAFVCSDLAGAMFELLRTRGYRYVRIAATSAQSECQLLDARQTIEAVGKLFCEKLDWLIVDQYQFDAVWERELQPYADRIFVIDDLADRQHDCDLLLDQNYDDAHRYEALVPSACSLLLGPRFALLRPEYAARRKLMGSRQGTVQRVLVFFGGTDQHNMTGLSLQALSSPELRYLKVDLVIGANYRFHDELKRQAAARPNSTIYGPRPHLADLMAQADIAIGAGGATNWERMCLALPSLVITLAQNQAPISEQLSHEGAIKLLGSDTGLTSEDIRQGLLSELQTQQYLRRIELAMKKCDGLGITRVSDALFSAID